MYQVGRLQAAQRIEVAAGGNALRIDRHQTRLEGGRGREDCVDVPIRSGTKRDALTLSIDDHARGDALHPAGRQPRHDLLPKHRADFVSVEPVEHPAGLLRVDERLVELAWVARRLLDRVAGDLVENHAAHRNPRLEHLEQVPGDCLAFAVFVSGEVQLVDVGERRFQLGDLLLLVSVDDVERLEPVVDVDTEARPRLLLVLGRDVGGRRRQITDVPDARLDDVAAAEVAGNGLRLRRRLDDHQAAGVAVRPAC